MNIEETLNKIGEKYSPLSIECQQAKSNKIRC